MIGLKEVMGKGLKTLDEYEKIIGIESNSYANKLNDELAKINLLMGELTSSKRNQFLKETCFYYNKLSSKI